MSTVDRHYKFLKVKRLLKLRLGYYQVVQTKWSLPAQSKEVVRDHPRY